MIAKKESPAGNEALKNGTEQSKDKNNPQNGVYLLDEIICNKVKNLEKYATLPNANQRYIDAQNAEIKKLNEVYNHIEHSYPLYFDLWVEIEKQIQVGKEKDSELNGVLILYRWRERTVDNFLKLDLP